MTEFGAISGVHHACTERAPGVHRLRTVCRQIVQRAGLPKGKQSVRSLRVQHDAAREILRDCRFSRLSLPILGALLGLALLPGRASADIATLAQSCFTAVEAQDASAYTQQIKRVSRSPETYLQTYKTNDGVMSVQMADNAILESFVCQVQGIERKEPGRAERVTVTWPAVAKKMDALFRRYANKPDFKIVEGRLAEDSLGVNALQAVRCSAPTMTISVGPLRVSDAGFLTPPFSMSALNEATFSVQMNSPMAGGMFNKYCK